MGVERPQAGTAGWAVLHSLGLGPLDPRPILRNLSLLNQGVGFHLTWTLPEAAIQGHNKPVRVKTPDDIDVTYSRCHLYVETRKKSPCFSLLRGMMHGALYSLHVVRGEGKPPRMEKCVPSEAVPGRVTESRAGRW